MPSKPKSAREAAVAMLAGRAFSSGSLAARLLEKGYPEQEAEAAVSWLQSLGYVDDAAYCASVIRAQRAKGYGPRRIAQYLQSKGISRQTAEEALFSDAGPEEDRDRAAEAIDTFLKRRAGSDPDRAERDKLAAALLRRGFEYSDIRAGLGRLCGEDDL